MKKLQHTIQKYFLYILILFSVQGTHAQVDSGYVKINGGEMFYRIWGEGDPVLFINGGPGLSSKGYETYADSLSKEFKVILFDQRGTGKSKIRNQYINFGEIIIDIEKLRKSLKIDSWHVMGHSFGGKVALYYLANKSSSIGKVILSSSLSLDIEDPDIQSMQKRITPNSYLTEYERKLKYLAELERRKQFPNEDFLIRLSSASQSRFYTHYEENIPTVGNWFIYKTERTDKRIKYDLPSHWRKESSRNLQQVDNQVLIIHGLSDFINIYNPMRNHELIKNSTLELIENAGHIISIDQPEEYFSKILNFLLE